MSALAARVAAVVPCKDEAERIAATVAAVAALPSVGRVVVVDDGSSDGTADAARAAGAEVVRHERNRGKAAALETGVRRVRELEAAEAVADPSEAWRAALLFVDGDLEATAANLGVLTEAVLDGSAAMTIATLPAQITAGGGRGWWSGCPAGASSPSRVSVRCNPSRACAASRRPPTTPPRRWPGAGGSRPP
ncbi:glycosyltransferase [Phycicoccus sp. HDW14]|uniref:glycosyltransferase n=1 Tax=Phycicoccus sp. HDW14 TaxID=2714941 RepID=UPI003530093D